MQIRLEALEEASKLIHLLYYRNKNQHRHALWWKWLSMLQRSVAKLGRALERGNDERASTRITHINNVLLPGCYVSFTHMVADSQFSALGLVLLSELAKVARLIRPPTYAVCVTGDSSRAGVVEDRESDARYRAEDLGEAVLRVSTSNVLSEGLQSSITDRGNVPDTEEIGRTVSPATIAESSDSTDYNVPIEASAQVPTRRTRRRKGMNLIDNLFSGLD